MTLCLWTHSFILFYLFHLFENVYDMTLAFEHVFEHVFDVVTLTNYHPLATKLPVLEHVLPVTNHPHLTIHCHGKIHPVRAV